MNLEWSHCEASLHKTFLSQPHQVHLRRPIPLFRGASGIKRYNSETRPKSPPQQPRLTWSTSHPMNRDRRFDVPNSYQDGGSANQSCRGVRKRRVRDCRSHSTCYWRSSRDSGDDSRSDEGNLQPSSNTWKFVSSLRPSQSQILPEAYQLTLSRVNF